MISMVRPTLHSEWQVVLILSTGDESAYHVQSEADAQEFAARFRFSRWRIEKRMCSPWAPVGPTMRSRVITEVADDAPGAEHTETGD